MSSFNHNYMQQFQTVLSPHWGKSDFAIYGDMIRLTYKNTIPLDINKITIPSLYDLKIFVEKTLKRDEPMSEELTTFLEIVLKNVID